MTLFSRVWVSVRKRERLKLRLQSLRDEDYFEEYFFFPTMYLCLNEPPKITLGTSLKKEQEDLHIASLYTDQPQHQHHLMLMFKA